MKRFATTTENDRKVSVFFLASVLLSATFAVATFTLPSLAKSPTPVTNEETQREGQLFTIRLVPGEPISFMVAGREEGKFDLSNFKLTVRRLTPYPAQELQVTKNGDVYSVLDPSDKTSPQELEVNATVKGSKTEKFKFKILPK
jgi:hypothetical protein